MSQSSHELGALGTAAARAGEAAVSVTRERADREPAMALLARYYEELGRRFPGGFAVGRTVAAEPEELVPPSGVFLVARVGGDPAGCGALRRLDATVAEIKRMWIDPRYRGRGIGRRLLAELEAAAVELGYGAVRLDTSAHLPEAIGLYRSSGYLEIKDYNENVYAAHWFEKRAR